MPSMANVGSWLYADIAECPLHVRFQGDSGHRTRTLGGGRRLKGGVIRNERRHFWLDEMAVYLREHAWARARSEVANASGERVRRTGRLALTV